LDVVRFRRLCVASSIELSANNSLSPILLGQFERRIQFFGGFAVLLLAGIRYRNGKLRFFLGQLAQTRHRSTIVALLLL
jgi:hypothetical protein